MLLVGSWGQISFSVVCFWVLLQVDTSFSFQTEVVLWQDFSLFYEHLLLTRLTPLSVLLSGPHYSLGPHTHTQTHTNTRVQAGFLNLISFPISCCHLSTSVTWGNYDTTANSLPWFVSLGTDGLPGFFSRAKSWWFFTLKVWMFFFFSKS